MARIKICLACSHGGHLTEMLQLAPAFDGHDTFYFCYDAETTKSLENAYRVPNIARNPMEMLANFFRVGWIFWKERPDLIVSTGAEIAIPVVLVGKLFRAHSVYIECGAQVTEPSFTGRIMSYVANELYVQWPELQAAYGPRAQLRGSFIDEVAPFPNDNATRQRAVVTIVHPPAAAPEMPHVSVARLASVLEQRGYVVRVIDAVAEKMVAGAVEKLIDVQSPDVIIFSDSDTYLQNLMQKVTRSTEAPPMLSWGRWGEQGFDASFERDDYVGVVRYLAQRFGADLLDDAPIDADVPPDWPLFPAAVR